MKRLGLLALMALCLLSGAGALAGDAFVEGVTALHAGRLKEGYALLEKGFESLEPGARRGQFASLLGLARQDQLSMPRYIYARVALNENRELSDAERLRLTRLMADDLFDKGQLDVAEKAFESALTLASKDSRYLDDQEYLTYKLGWVYLNYQRASEAHELWSKWLGAQGAGKLRRLMLKDAGRAWAESLFQNGESSFQLAVADAAERAVVVEGFLAGLRRESKPDLAVVLKRVAATPLKDDAIKALLEDGNLFTGKPCVAVEYVLASERALSQLSGETLKSYAHRCAKEAGVRVAGLAALYARLNLTGIDRQPKAHVLKANGQQREACHEYGELALEALADRKLLRELPDVAASLVNDCKGELAEPRVAEAALRSETLAAETKRDSKTWLPVLMAFVGGPDYSDKALNALLERKELWNGTALPALALESQRAKASRADRIFETFSSQPLTTQHRAYLAGRVRAFIDAANFASAKDWLERYLPLERADFEGARLWGLLRIAAPETVATGQIEETYARLLAAEAKPRAEDARAFVYMLVDRKDWAAVWKNYGVVAPVFARDAGLLRDLVVATAENLSVLLPTLKAQEHSEVARFLVQASALLDDNDEKLALSVPSLVKALPLAKDAEALRAVRLLEKDYAALSLKLSPSLQNVLARKINGLKSKMQAAGRHKWASEAFLQAADRSVVRSAHGLADAITRLEAPDEASRQELQSLAEVIRGWKLIGGGQSS